MKTIILLIAILMVPVATADILSGGLLQRARIAGSRVRRRLA